MKVGILTHYDVNNLGAQLQMYATYHWLLEHGHTPVVLTYNKNFDFEYEQKLRNQISFRSIPYIIREFLIKKGFFQTLHNTKKYLQNVNFRRNSFNTEFYATSDVDAVIVGADEVFSIPVGVNTMMYGYGMKTNNFIGYAPSFGETSLEDLRRHNVEVLISEGLKTFVSLSARDAHTKKLISDMTGRQVEDVCDPVILYRFKQNNPAKSFIKDKYLAIYSYDRNMIDRNEIKAITDFARNNGLKTASIGNYHKWCDYNVVCNCIEWLDLINKAEFVVTDTFHGVVVSTILQKQMVVYKRSINTNKLTALLFTLGLEDRCASSINIMELQNIFSKRIDYKVINKKIDLIREKSEKYLIESLEKCK